jgi:hypothetical protein
MIKPVLVLVLILNFWGCQRLEERMQNDESIRKAPEITELATFALG